jgi:hypothetical protein
MKTASHFTYFGPGRIVISRGTPRGDKLAGYKIFKPLMPTRDILSISNQAQYRERYFEEVLGMLDPQRTWTELHWLAKQTEPAGTEPVLLCFERPPFGPDNWCHRRMVADWFKETLGHDVPEFGEA